MDVLVAHHGHCFDGAASAAIFTRFVREKLEANARIGYKGLAYDPGAPPLGELLRKGAVNAILDFRYTASPLLDWYFDHHVSAFQEPGSKEHFSADTTGKKFHDGTYGSNTRFMIDRLKEHFGWEAPDLKDLVYWADIIDSARFPDAETACSYVQPAMQITAVVQEHGDDAFCAELIPMLGQRSLVELAALPLIADRLAPIRQRNEVLEQRMARAGEQKNDVACFDLSDAPLESVGKFIAYRLFPTALYAVVLSRSNKRIKLSIGFNPWTRKSRRHNIAELCERYGGGGHPVVGAISLQGNEMDKARKIYAELIEALNT